MTTIKYEDFVSSIADALQFISYYHPKDYLQHLARAYEREQSPAANASTTPPMDSEAMNRRTLLNTLVFPRSVKSSAQSRCAAPG